MSWRVDLMSASFILAVVLGVLATAYLLIQTFVVGSIGWSRLVTRTPDETHSQICRDDAGKTSARPAYGRDCPCASKHWTTAGNVPTQCPQASPVGALAEHRPAWSRFIDRHDRRLGWVH